MNRLVGKRWEFFGANENCFQVREVGTSERRIFEAIEDPSDGYRSSLKELKEIEQAEATARNLFFSAVPLAEVAVTEPDRFQHYRDIDYPFDGMALVDDKGHAWLTVGTENFDDYYPSFVFAYSPPGPVTA